MSSCRPIPLALSLALALAACAAPRPNPVAAAMLEAFNAHDPAAMASLVTEDFELYYVSDAGVAELGSRGREALQRDMVAYFAARPAVRSAIEGVVPGDRFVAFRERIVGGASSLAVYEVQDSLLRRAWYYPSEQ